MPRKSKKSTEPEAAAAPAPEATESAEPQANAAPAESDLPMKKTARKARARKTVAAEPAEAEVAVPEPPAVISAAPGVAEAEAKAQAADTFEDAFDANGVGEAPPAAESEPPKKARKTKAAKARAPEPSPEPSQDQHDEFGPDEDDELEGDWESGSGAKEKEEEGENGNERKASPLPAPKLERLQKILAAAGVASRRHAEQLIAEGRVQVNGKPVTELGSKADAARDHIRVDGKLLHGAERLRYFVLNKPRGYVTTVSDPEGRATVMEFFSRMGERLYPVGRLDYLSEGLLLMTNDGELANKLTRAASGVEKTYLVKVSGQPGEDTIEALREGIGIDRGRPGEGRVQTSPARIQQVRSGDNPWFEVTLIEGRNRELRKMFEEIGHHVEKIRRVGYGPLVLDLEPGQMRELDEEELRLLRLAAEGKWKPKRVRPSSMLPKEAGRSIDHEAGKKGGRGWRPPYQDRSRGGARPSAGAGRGLDRDVAQDRGAAAPRGEDWRQGGWGGQDRNRPGGPRPQGRPAFGAPGRTGESGGQHGGTGSGFSRPQGNRPFRGKPAYDRDRRGEEGRPARPAPPRNAEEGRTFRPSAERPHHDRPRSERPAGGGGERRFGSRPPRPARFGEREEGRGFKPRSERPSAGRGFRPRPERPADSRSGQSFTPRPPRPPRLHIEEDGAGFKPRADRPADRRTDQPAFRPRNDRPSEPRGEQRFGARPPRPAGSGYRPARGSNENRGQTGVGQARGPAGGFGQSRSGGQRPSGTARGEGGVPRPAFRTGPSGGNRGGTGGKPSPGGKPRFGSENRGRSGSGPRGGKRPGSGPRGNRPGR